MEPDASNRSTSLDLMRSNSDDYCQSSDEGETHDGNNAGDNSVRIEPARTRPHISHTHSWCDADSSYTVTCTVNMVLAVPRGAGSFCLLLQTVFTVVKIKTDSDGWNSLLYSICVPSLCHPILRPIHVDIIKYICSVFCSHLCSENVVFSGIKVLEMIQLWPQRKRGNSRKSSLIVL